MNADGTGRNELILVENFAEEFKARKKTTMNPQGAPSSARLLKPETRRHGERVPRLTSTLWINIIHEEDKNCPPDGQYS